MCQDAFDKLSRATRQVEALMAYLQLARGQEFVRREELYKMAKVDASVIAAMEKKEILEVYEREVSRIGGYEDEIVEADAPSEQQVRSIAEIQSHFEEKNVVLLQGVTGSGKTRVYIELIREAMRRGEQTLYLLPEIALTTQIIDRLKRIFGDQVDVYHSRLSNNERVEIWNRTKEGKALVLGAPPRKNPDQSGYVLRNHFPRRSSPVKKILTTPIKDEDLKDLNVGDVVYLSGIASWPSMWTALWRRLRQPA